MLRTISINVLTIIALINLVFCKTDHRTNFTNQDSGVDKTQTTTIPTNKDPYSIDCLIHDNESKQELRKFQSSELYPEIQAQVDIDILKSLMRAKLKKYTSLPNLENAILFKIRIPILTLILKQQNRKNSIRIAKQLLELNPDLYLARDGIDDYNIPYVFAVKNKFYGIAEKILQSIIKKKNTHSFKELYNLSLDNIVTLLNEKDKDDKNEDLNQLFNSVIVVIKRSKQNISKNHIIKLLISTKKLNVFKKLLSVYDFEAQDLENITIGAINNSNYEILDHLLQNSKYSSDIMNTPSVVDILIRRYYIKKKEQSKQIKSQIVLAPYQDHEKIETTIKNIVQNNKYKPENFKKAFIIAIIKKGDKYIIDLFLNNKQKLNKCNNKDKTDIIDNLIQRANPTILSQVLGKYKELHKFITENHLKNLLKDTGFNKYKGDKRRIQCIKELLKYRKDLKDIDLIKDMKCESVNEENILNTIIDEKIVNRNNKCDLKIEDEKAFLQEINKKSKDLQFSEPVFSKIDYITGGEESEYDIYNILGKNEEEQKTKEKEDYDLLKVSDLNDKHRLLLGFDGIAHINIFGLDIILFGSDHETVHIPSVKYVIKCIDDYSQIEKNTQKIPFILEGIDPLCENIQNLTSEKTFETYYKDNRVENHLIFETFHDFNKYEQLISEGEQFYTMDKKSINKVVSRFSRLYEPIIKRIKKYTFKYEDFKKYLNMKYYDNIEIEFKSLINDKDNFIPNNKSSIYEYLNRWILLFAKIQDYFTLFHIYLNKDRKKLVAMACGSLHVSNITKIINNSHVKYVNKQWSHCDRARKFFDPKKVIPENNLVYLGNIEDDIQIILKKYTPVMSPLLKKIFKNTTSYNIIALKKHIKNLNNTEIKYIGQGTKKRF